MDRWATFDCYGTLIDWARGIGAALGNLWPQQDVGRLLEGYHKIEPQVQANGALTYREVLRLTLERLAAENKLPISAGQAGMLGDSLPFWPPFPEVPAALQELRRRGWRLAILSNTDPDLLSASLRQLRTTVDLTITAAGAGSYKPAHGHWLRFREASEMAAGRQVHVAASLFHDIAPAAALGIPTVWINRPGDVTNEMHSDLWDLPRAEELPNLSRLPDLLDLLVAE